MPSLLVGTTLIPSLTLFAVVATVVGGLVTALVATRRRLRASQEAFREHFSHAPIGILQADANGMCTYANAAWCRLAGLSLEQTVGHFWSRAVHPDDVAEVMRKWEASVREARPYLNEVRLVRPDGSIRTVLATARPMHDGQGRLSGFIGTVMDMTEVLDARKQVRDQQSLLQSLVDHSSAVIYLKDLQSRYLLVNKRHIDLFPEMRDFRLGTTPYDWFPTTTAKAFIESDAQVVRTGREFTFTENVVHDGEPRTYVSVKFPVTDEKGAVIAVGGVSTDVTDLEQTRRHLAQKENVLRRLIDVQEQEKQLLCHEFHDGLIQYAVGAIMLLETMAEEDRTLSPEARETVTAAVACLRRGVDDGRRVIRGIRPAALDDLGLKAAIEDLLTQMREAGFSVTAQLDPNIDTIPPGLQTTAYRIVQESLSNVRKYSGSSSVEVGMRRTDDTVELHVADQGRGFDPQAAGRQGFGLVGMNERVRLAGGECRIESAPGTGARIDVRLPLADRNGAASMIPGASAQGLP
ncbi:MAG: PAS domain-containing protein [Pirellulales bacterium]